jgi:hypothetical protein
MTLINNHELVMNLNVEQLVEQRKYFSTDGMENNSSQAHAEREGYFMPSQTWEEMGSPEQITIQVVPGDALVHDDSEGEAVTQDSSPAEPVEENPNQESPEVVQETTTERVTEAPAEPNSLGNVNEAVAGQPTETVRETETERVVQEPAEQGDSEGLSDQDSSDSN